MGRYYYGDIEGKFWFAVQSSNAAKRFGGTECTPEVVEYWFDEDELDKVNDEIDKIKKSLNVSKLENFFNGDGGYNDDMLKEANITQKEVSEYADLLLGIKIRDCIVEQGSCSFTAEL